MTITPHFTLSQTLDNVLVEISVPHVRVSVDTVEVVVDGPNLHFSSPPYLLLLTFPDALAEDNNESGTAAYDPIREGGMVTLELRKQRPEIWKDLDLMGRLMRPKSFASSRVCTQVVSQQHTDVTEEEEKSHRGAISSTTSVLEQLTNVSKPRYGFLNQFVGVYRDLARDGLATEMLELPYPDDATDRRKQRLCMEQEKFDADRYVGDLDVQDDYLYQCAIAMRPHWTTTSCSVEDLTHKMSSLTTKSSKESKYGSFFTKDELSQLARIPYPLLPPEITFGQQQSLLLGLLDILFAYTYDHLMTDGEPTIESSWTISILSCQLSWLDSYDETDCIENVVCNSVRRSLVYPYIRNFDFSLCCWDHVSQIVQGGRRCIIRCLLQVRQILDKSELHYLGNRIFIDPYLAWIQKKLEESVLNSFCDHLMTISSRSTGAWIRKETVGLGLGELEGGLNEEGSESDEDDSSNEDTSSEDPTLEIDSKLAKHHEDNVQEIETSPDLLDSEIGSLAMIRISQNQVTERHIERTGSKEGSSKTLIQEIT